MAPETQRRQRSLQPEGVTQEERGCAGGSPLVGRSGRGGGGGLGVGGERERRKKREGVRGEAG